MKEDFKVVIPEEIEEYLDISKKRVQKTIKKERKNVKRAVKKLNKKGENR